MRWSIGLLSAPRQYAPANSVSENAPFPGAPSRTVRVQIHCNPCRRGCAAVTCMRVIPPEAVIDAALGLLATTGGRCETAPARRG